jgi:acetyl-CoA C-acetyltransferase
MTRSLHDRVAIVGMGCTKFGELWNCSAMDLAVEAAFAALASADMAKEAVDAYWFGTLASAHSGVPLARALKVDRPVTRVENFCATGSEAFRNAAFAVACGAYDVAMAVGVEKLKDDGHSGLWLQRPANDNTTAVISNPAVYAQLIESYVKKYGVPYEVVREALTHIAWKNHGNGAKNTERAQYTSPVSKDRIDASPRVAGDLGVMDCSGVSDGAAAAIIVRAEDALAYTSRPMYLKGMSLLSGTGAGVTTPGVEHYSFPEVVSCAADAYRQAGVTNPRHQISFAEVHDCFTPTELILMEDLGFSERGEACTDVLEGTYDLDGRLPINPDGGLKSFGHPVGASGLRMMYELWLQFRGEAAERQLPEVELGLTQNMGGLPGEFVAFVSIFGKELG